MVGPLIIFRVTLSGQRIKKVLTSYETGCNVNLKHTCIKTGAGGGGGETIPRDLRAFSFLLLSGS